MIFFAKQFWLVVNEIILNKGHSYTVSMVVHTNSTTIPSLSLSMYFLASTNAEEILRNENEAHLENLLS